jgi:hypothetical protein
MEFIRLAAFVMNSEVAECSSAVFPAKQRLKDGCDKVWISYLI